MAEGCAHRRKSLEGIYLQDWTLVNMQLQFSAWRSLAALPGLVHAHCACKGQPHRQVSRGWWLLLWIPDMQCAVSAMGGPVMGLPRLCTLVPNRLCAPGVWLGQSATRFSQHTHHWWPCNAEGVKQSMVEPGRYPILLQGPSSILHCVSKTAEHSAGKLAETQHSEFSHGSPTV